MEIKGCCFTGNNIWLSKNVSTNFPVELDQDESLTEPPILHFPFSFLFAFHNILVEVIYSSCQYANMTKGLSTGEFLQL